jgi:hypothetical protein
MAARRLSRSEQESRVRGREMHAGRFQEQRELDGIRSAHTTLFIYLHPIVLLAPGNIAISVSKVRRGRAHEGVICVMSIAFAIIL